MYLRSAKATAKLVASPFQGAYAGIKFATGNDKRKLKDPKYAAAAGAAGAVGVFTGLIGGVKQASKAAGKNIEELPRPVRKAAKKGGHVAAPVGAFLGGALAVPIVARYAPGAALSTGVKVAGGVVAGTAAGAGAALTLPKLLAGDGQDATPELPGRTSPQPSEASETPSAGGQRKESGKPPASHGVRRKPGGKAVGKRSKRNANGHGLDGTAGKRGTTRNRKDGTGGAGSAQLATGRSRSRGRSRGRGSRGLGAVSPEEAKVLKALEGRGWEVSLSPR